MLNNQHIYLYRISYYVFKIKQDGMMKYYQQQCSNVYLSIFCFNVMRLLRFTRP